MTLQRFFTPNYIPGLFRHDYANSPWGSYYASTSFLDSFVSNIDVWGVWGSWALPNPATGTILGNWETNLYAYLKSKGKKFNLGQGYISNTTTGNGAATATADKAYIADIISHASGASNGSDVILTVDGHPGIMLNNGFTLTQCNNELVSYMQSIHTTYPGVTIGIDVNFPGWPYNGTPGYLGPGSAPSSTTDYATVLNSMVAAVNAAGEHLDFLQVDNPYELTLKGSFADSRVDPMDRIMQLEQQAHGLGLKFAPMFNSGRAGYGSSPPSGFSLDGPFSQRQNNAVNDALFFADVLNYQAAYLARGGTPDQLILISWFPGPSELYPSTKPFTFTNLWNALLAGKKPGPQFAWS